MKRDGLNKLLDDEFKMARQQDRGRQKEIKRNGLVNSGRNGCVLSLGATRSRRVSKTDRTLLTTFVTGNRLKTGNYLQA